MRKRLRKKAAFSMKCQLIIAFLALGIFLTLAVSMIGYQTFKTTLISEIGNNRLDVLRQVGERVRQVKSNVYTVSNLYQNDYTLRQYLEELNSSDTAASREQVNSCMERLTRQFKNSFYTENIEFDVVLAFENRGGYSSKEVAESYDYMSPKTKIWYKKILEAKGDMVDIANYEDKADGKEYFSVARVIQGEDGLPLAYLMLNVEEKKIRSMYQSVIRDKQNTIYIVDKEGTIISSSSENLNGFNFFNMKNLDKLFGDRSYTFTKMHNEDILFTRYKEETSDFTVLEEIPLRILTEPIRRVRFSIAMVAFLAIGAASLYVCFFSNRVTKPISKLCDFMLSVEEGNLDKECQVEGYVEINVLKNRLNLMLGRIRELLDGIRQKEQQKRKMELSFLQAQINPHFMYNTLFSIKCMVDMEKNDEASRMITSFIQLLRSTLSNPNEFATVQQEMYGLEQYVEIQKFRYDDKFQVIFQCDEEVREKKLPKLLIQPLLENAIFHGVEFRKEDGLIIITACQKKGDLVITVEDNGIGISQEMVEKINEGKIAGAKTHVGILNVKERIQLNFGENYGMKIESVSWQGTKIILTLPLID